jgi:hypothetical protein
VFSVYTRYIVEGLRSGEPDVDGDGWISVEELHDYVAGKVRTSPSPQTPQRWVYGVDAKILFARSLRDRATPPAPPRLDLKTALESRHPDIRMAAVRQLAKLRDDRLDRRNWIDSLLTQIANEDIPRVAHLARKALQAPPGQSWLALATESMMAHPFSIPFRPTIAPLHTDVTDLMLDDLLATPLDAPPTLSWPKDDDSDG